MKVIGLADAVRQPEEQQPGTTMNELSLMFRKRLINFKGASNKTLKLFSLVFMVAFSAVFADSKADLEK